METHMSDKRTSPRASTNIEIMFKETGSFIRSYMLNVSNGGLFIKTDNPLPLESEVKLKVILPDDTEIMEIQGQVVWVNPPTARNSFPVGMGIQFMDLMPEHKMKIEEFVQKYHKAIKDNAFL